MKYTMLGQNLPELYKNHQDPIFHIDEGYDLAKGEGWIARVSACGEISPTYKGEWIDPLDLIEILDDDKKLSEAEDKGDLIFNMNNWFEVEFFTTVGDQMNYVDLMADDTVCFSFTEALQVFNNYINDPQFQRDLAKWVEQDEFGAKIKAENEAKVLTNNNNYDTIGDNR